MPFGERPVCAAASSSAASGGRRLGGAGGCRQRCRAVGVAKQGHVRGDRLRARSAGARGRPARVLCVRVPAGCGPIWCYLRVQRFPAISVPCAAAATRTATSEAADCGRPRRKPNAHHRNERAASQALSPTALAEAETKARAAEAQLLAHPPPAASSGRSKGAAASVAIPAAATDAPIITAVAEGVHRGSPARVSGTRKPIECGRGSAFVRHRPPCQQMRARAQTHTLTRTPARTLAQARGSSRARRWAAEARAAAHVARCASRALDRRRRRCARLGEQRGLP
jgi:hypothetical protein